MKLWFLNTYQMIGYRRSGSGENNNFMDSSPQRLQWECATI